MQSLAFPVGLLIFFITVCGFSALLKQIPRVNSLFLPFLAVCAITVLTHIGGMLGLLELAVKAVALAGVILFALHVWQSIRRREKPEFFKTPFLVFLTLCMAMVFLLKGRYYTHIDNFSHWGMVIKEMFYFAAFPDSESVVSMFSSYPLGTASFNYFVCKLIGYSESHSMMAQSFIIAAIIPVAFCRCEKLLSVKTLAIFLAEAIALAVMVYDDGSLHITNLLVDFLVGFIFAAIIIIMDYYRKDFRTATWLCALMFLFYVMVKDSAKLFIAMSVIYLLIQTKGDSSLSTRSRITGTIIMLVPVFAACILWDVHLSSVYGIEKSTTFARYGMTDISASEISLVFQLVVEKYFRSLFNFKSLPFIVYLMSVLSSLIAGFAARKDGDSSLLKKIILVDVFSLVYLASLFAMFLVVMKDVAAFDRYFCTFVVSISLVSAYLVANMLKLDTMRRIIPTLSIEFIALFMLIPKVCESLELPKLSEMRAGLVEFADTVPLGREYNYYIRSSSDELWQYQLHIAAYELLTRNRVCMNESIVPALKEGAFDCVLDLRQEDIAPSRIEETGYYAVYGEKFIAYIKTGS